MGNFSRNEDKLLDCDLGVVDETPMVDVLLMYATLQALPKTSGLIITRSRIAHEIFFEVHIGAHCAIPSMWMVCGWRMLRKFQRSARLKS